MQHCLVDDTLIRTALQEIGMQIALLDTAQQTSQEANVSTLTHKSWWLAGLGLAGAILAEVIAWIST